MVLVELELKAVFYLALILWGVTFQLKTSIFKGALLMLFYPLALIIALMMLGTTYGTPIITLLGILFTVTMLKGAHYYFTMYLPQEKQNKRNKLLNNKRF